MLADAFVIFMLSCWTYGTSSSKNNYHVPKSKKKKAARKRQKKRHVEQLSSPIDLNVFDETFKDKTPDEKEDFIFDILMKYKKSHKIFSCKSYLCHTFEKFSKHASNSFICKYNEHITQLTYHVKYRLSVLNLMSMNLLETEHDFTEFIVFPINKDDPKLRKCLVCKKDGTVITDNTTELDAIISPCKEKIFIENPTTDEEMTNQVFQFFVKDNIEISDVKLYWFIHYGFVSKISTKYILSEHPIFTSHKVIVQGKDKNKLRCSSEFNILKSMLGVLKFVKKYKFIVSIDSIKFLDNGFEMTILSKYKSFFNDDGTLSPENEINYNKKRSIFAKKIAKEIRWECYCKEDICDEDEIIIINKSVSGDGIWNDY